MECVDIDATRTNDPTSRTNEATKTTEKPNTVVGRRDFSPSERRCLELLLAPVVRLRAEADRLEQAALLEVRAFAVERLGLPAACRIRILRKEGEIVGFLAEPEE